MSKLNQLDSYDAAEACLLVTKLSQELASEIDLHYDDEDLSALETSVAPLVEAKAYLQRANVPVPNVVEHILKRFRRHFM